MDLKNFREVKRKMDDTDICLIWTRGHVFHGRGVASTSGSRDLLSDTQHAVFPPQKGMSDLCWSVFAQDCRFSPQNNYYKSGAFA